MPKFLLTAAALAFFLAGQTLTSLGGTPDSLAAIKAASGVSLSGSGAATGGVTLSVSTSGFEFTPLIGVLIPPVASGSMVAFDPIPLPPQGINVAVTLHNHTGQKIAFELGVTGSPDVMFQFQVYNSSGALVWDSLAGANPDLVRSVTLKGKEAWHGSAFVPLFINGEPLPAGNYTLVTSLYGTPAFSTTTSFVVDNVIAIN